MKHFRKPLSEEGVHAAAAAVEVPNYDPQYAYLYLLTFKNFHFLKERQKGADHDHGESKHLNFILSAGKHLEPSKICPCCHKNKVRFFSFVDGKFTSCCGDNRCKCHQGKLYPIQLEAFEQNIFRSSAVRDQLEIFLKSSMGLPEKLSPIDVHTFLAKVCARRRN